MSVMAQERQDQAAPATIKRPASGIAIDPGRLAWYRESDDMGHPTWSRQDLSDVVARLGLTDENDDPLTVTRDAIAKIENGERKPKARTIRALCAALGISVRDLMPGGDQLIPHDAAEERKLRLAHNKDLRSFARAHGIQYRNPVSGRVYYSVPLEAAFAASVAGTDDEETAGLVAEARGADLPEGGADTPAGNGVTADDGIDELDLSVRTHNALIRHGVRTIAELIALDERRLRDFRGLGAASVAEIREKLDAAGFALAEPGPAPEPVPDDVQPEPAPELVPDDMKHVLSGLTGTDSITNLHLSARPLNMLFRQGVGTIGELAVLTPYDLEHIPNLGAKSVREIREKLGAAGFTLHGEGTGSPDPDLLAS